MTHARIASVAQVMHRDVVTVDKTTLATDALARMNEEHVRHAVVVDGATIVGVVSDRDVLRFGARIGSTWLVHDVMSAPAIAIPPEMSITDAAHLFRARHIGCLPVVRGGTLVGIVTRTDLLGVLEHRGGRLPRPVRCQFSLREKWP